MGMRGAEHGERDRDEAELEQSVAARRLEIILALGRRAGDQFDLPRVEPEPGISGLRLRLDRAVVRQQYALRTALDDRGSNRALGDVGQALRCEDDRDILLRSEEHTSELQSLMR